MLASSLSRPTACRRALPLLCAAWLALLASACDAPRSAAPAPPEPPIAAGSTDAPVPEPAPAVAEAPARAAPPPAAETPELDQETVKPLADLLRLPAAPPPEPEKPEDPLALRAQDEGGETKAAKSGPRRVELEFESTTDESKLIKDKARTRTDAGVSLRTGKDTRLKGGVRVEQEQGLERESPVPTVGIEKRF